MTKNTFLTVLLIFLTLVSACSRPKTNTVSTENSNTDSKHIASTSVVKVAASGLEISKGQSGEALVKLSIDQGYHVNANPPTYSYLKATEIEVPKTKDIAVNFVVYPDGKSRKFAFAEKPLSVYEGENVIKISLKADKAAQGGKQNLPATLRVQACDEEVCYPPGELSLQIPVTIK